MRARLIASVLAILSLAGPAFAQNDRRDRQSPELLVDSGGRLGSCDAIQFTRDGKYLLAIGDDKVVRIWPYRDGKLTKDGMQVLRWPSWREQRGAIFALALSPDKDNERLAIAGLGTRTANVALLERKTGKILHLTTPVAPTGHKVNAIWSLDFAPDGRRVAFGDSHGGVWTWDFAAEPRLLGEHQSARETNVVRFVHFFGDDTLVSVVEEGGIKRWDLGKNPTGKDLPRFKIPANGSLFRVAISPDEKWYAAATKGPLVVLRSVADGERSIPVPLGPREFARAVAFDTKSERLAVSIASTLDTPFYMEGPERVVFYDLKNARDHSKPLERSDGPRGLYRAWYFAFHPDGKEVAIAAGENHEVTLYNLAAMRKPVSVMDGVGRSIWEVAMSEDGKQVGFRDERNPDATDPNGRAQGPWRVFHLGKREWTDPAAFQALKQHRTCENWTVQPSPTDPFLWYAVMPGGKKLKLPINGKLFGMPRSYTFIPPAGKRPLRLAVGHLWGLSVFEFSGGEAKLVRLCIGHQADVTSVAASADGSWLVSGSTDQTLAGWSLKDWESQATLGANFEVQGDHLVVKKVDIGSPAWEAGLVPEDVVTSFHFDGKRDKVPGGPEAWLAQLRNPAPGKEHGFRIVRDGKVLNPPLATTLRQRPLWRFFPTRDGEWVLWMWQNSYYDSSTKGDFYIGWLVNAPELDREPTFYRAEQFRKQYRRRSVLDKLLASNNVAEALRFALGNNPQPTRFNENEPPAVTIKLAAATTKNDDVKVTLTARPQGGNIDFQPVRAELWINGFRLLEDRKPGNWRKNGTVLEREVTIPAAKLQAGENVLTYQVYNRAGGRAEAAEILTCTRPPAEPRLFGLMVGVNKYGHSQVATPAGRGQLRDLNSACRDAATLRDALLGQKGLYKETDLIIQLDEKATRDDILAALKKLADKVGPEDRCVIYLGGHGTFDAEANPDDATWRFCCPNFDDTKAAATSVTDEELQMKLAAIAGRKVVVLDACHSGQAAAENPVRWLVPSGQGPIILAACDRNQEALENKEHGLFTAAILEALGEKFNDAAEGNKTLDARQLFKFTRREMPALLKDIKAPPFAQVPIWFAPEDVKLYPLAKGKE